MYISKIFFYLFFIIITHRISPHDNDNYNSEDDINNDKNRVTLTIIMIIIIVPMRLYTCHVYMYI